jgi:Phytanoyl-CoA dioxygenase (PhyH)
VQSHASARAQREQLQRDGFAIFPDALNREESALLADALEAPANLARRQATAEILARPAISELAASSGLTVIVREFLGPDAFPFRAALLGQPCAAAWKLDWHQDTSLPMRSLREGQGWGPWLVKAGIVHSQAPAGALADVLSLRLPLRSASPHAAPLRVLPGTHLLGVLDDAELSRLVCQRAALDCVVPRGGVLALKPLLVHAPGEHPSPVPPRMLVIDYATPALLAEGLALPS